MAEDQATSNVGFYEGSGVAATGCLQRRSKGIQYFVILGTIGIMISGLVMSFQTHFPTDCEADRPTGPLSFGLCDRCRG